MSKARYILGRNDEGEVGFDLDLLRSGRLLMQASSGGGKSETLKKIATLIIPVMPVLIVDGESEYAPLRADLPFLLVGPGGEVPATLETVDEVVSLILKTGVSVIFDLFELGTRKFEYAAKLFTALDEAAKGERRDLLVIVDEAHMFAPKDVKLQRVSSVPFADLMSRGRKRGITCVAATQRMQSLHNDIIDLCENRLYGRTSLTSADTVARSLGFTGAALKEFTREIQLVKDGQFYAWGRAFHVQEPTLFQVERVPGPTLAKVGRSQRRTTPPTPASIKHLLPKFAELPKEVAKKATTLKELNEALAAAQKKIRDLERVAAKPVAAPAAPRAQAVAPSVDKENLRMLAKKLDVLSNQLADAARLATEDEARWARAAELLAELQKLLVPQGGMGKALKRVAETRDAASALLPGIAPKVADVVYEPTKAAAPRAVRPAAPAGDVERSVPKAQARILDAIAWIEATGLTPSNVLIGFVAGYSSTARNFNNLRGALRSAGLVDYRNGGMYLTEEGRRLAVATDVPLTDEGLQAMVMEKLSPAQRKLLVPLIAAYPKSMTLEELGAASGYSHTAGNFNNLRGNLRTWGLVDYPERGRVAAAACLFMETHQ